MTPGQCERRDFNQKLLSCAVYKRKEVKNDEKY